LPPPWIEARREEVERVGELVDEERRALVMFERVFVDG